MPEAVFFDEDYRTGFSIALTESTGITVRIGETSHDFEIAIRSRKNFAKTGFSPDRAEDFLQALKDRAVASFDGQTLNDGPIWGDRVTVTPKANGKAQIRAAEGGNPAATITLACDEMAALVAALEALSVVIPTDTKRLLGHMDDDHDERFWNDNPNLRAKIDNMILEKRYSLAFNTYHTTHQHWFKTVREPEFVGKPITEGRRRAIGAVLAALGEDS